MTFKRSLARNFRDVLKRLGRQPVGGSTTMLDPSNDSRVDMARALNQLDLIRADCRRLVTRRASLSAGAAIVPLPGLDIGTDLAILLKLLPQINERFGLTPAQVDALDVETKRIVMVFASGVGSMLIGRLVTREVVIRMLMKMGVRILTAGIVKYVPLLGSALAASLNFGAMKLLGDKHVDDCHEVARRTLLARAEASNVRDVTPRS